MKTHCLLSQCCEEYIVSNGSLNSSFFILLKPTCWQCLVSINWPHCACRASHLHAHILRVPFSPDGALGHFSSDATGLPALVMSPGSHISCTDLRNVLFPSPGQCLLAFCSHLSILPACLPPAMVRWRTSCWWFWYSLLLSFLNLSWETGNESQLSAYSIWRKWFWRNQKLVDKPIRCVQFLNSVTLHAVLLLSLTLLTSKDLSKSYSLLPSNCWNT